jgi:GNAT superfamily N-acetyltransferase
MCFAGAGSRANQAMGLGMNGPVDGAELDRLIAFYESRGVEPRIEVCPLADDSLVRGLADREFVVREFEHVLVRELDHTPIPTPPTEIDIQRVDVRDPCQVEQFIAVQLAGFPSDHPDIAARLAKRALLAQGVVGFLAMVDGTCVAAGACEARSPGAALFGAATLEGYRRRGCQRALMIARLNAVKEAGCRYACIGSKPQVATGRNAMRLGFQVAYTKAIMVRPAEGLTPSP